MSHPDYKRLFPQLERFTPDSDDLQLCATAMSSRSLTASNGSAGTSNNGTAANAESVPAGYTYLGQLIAHDLSRDAASDRSQSRHRPWELADDDSIDRLSNHHAANFNLESIYGHENPRVDGDVPRSLLRNSSPDRNDRLKLGYTLPDPLIDATAGDAFPCDLPRGIASVNAMIADPRNDENLIVAQTHVAFLKFHNAIEIELNRFGEAERAADRFEAVRRLVIRYYQTIVLTDYLPRFVSDEVYSDTVTAARRRPSFYRPDLFIPLEFTLGAFRFGHSMIRESYALNRLHPKATLRDISIFTGRGTMDSFQLEPRLRLPSDWLIDWNRFYEIDGKCENVAEPIDTNLVLSLLSLRPSAVGDQNGLANSLAALDLFRGRRLGLPSGQAVARQMGVDPLTPGQITDLFHSMPMVGVDLAARAEARERLAEAFKDESPFWFYCLAEAQLIGNGRLGPVGGRIVAETFMQLLEESDYSILREDWAEGEDVLLFGSGKFDMPSLLKFVREVGFKCFGDLYPDSNSPFDELNPLGNVEKQKTE